jgi:hypothetical protein
MKYEPARYGMAQKKAAEFALRQKWLEVHLAADNYEEHTL